MIRTKPHFFLPFKVGLRFALDQCPVAKAKWAWKWDQVLGIHFPGKQNLWLHKICKQSSPGPSHYLPHVWLSVWCCSLIGCLFYVRCNVIHFSPKSHFFSHLSTKCCSKCLRDWFWQLWNWSWCSWSAVILTWNSPMEAILFHNLWPYLRQVASRC